MIILSCILSILIFHSSSKDTSILLDPKSEFVDYVIPINAKVMVYNDEQLKDFKEKHKQDKLIDMTKKLVLNDENIHDKFPTGNNIFRAHFIFILYFILWSLSGAEGMAISIDICLSGSQVF